METDVPRYVSCAVPVPVGQRGPWYKSPFPTYGGIFLWVGFYLKLAGPTLGFADVGVCLAGLLVAGLLCFGLYYYVPAMLGMQSGQPLYIVATSTFGVKGGYLIPGLLMGVLQIGWVAVIASVSASFIMNGLGQTAPILFDTIVVAWLASLGWVAVRGIHHVGRIAKFLNWVPLLMILIVVWANRSGIARYQVPQRDELAGFLNIQSIVIGFFATAGAAGADFGMHNRDRRDVFLGGGLGIVGGALIAGGLPILSVAGYIGRGAGSSYDFSAAIASVGVLAPAMFFLFAAASMVPTCFSSFIAANSFSTMLPRIPRSIATFGAISVSAILAITGAANNLIGFFGIVGASFGPICGAMMADYLLSARRWTGPRQGINWAGYTAWLLGFLTGIPEHLPGLPAAWVKADNPAGLYSFAVGFLVYLLLGRLGKVPPRLDAKPMALEQNQLA
ncbi:MAG: cytosine permease [Terracidiphilus sp.]